eukprot:2334686-Rhodomonas_salina.1
MQAPKRDRETATKWASAKELLVQGDENEEERPLAFCKALEMLLERANIIRIDSANARLKSIAPVIGMHGVEYERAQMKKRVKIAIEANPNGPNPLKRTEKWMEDAVRREVEKGSVTLESLVEGRGDAFEIVHKQAVLALVMEASAPTEESCPETLALDLTRLKAAHNEFHFDVVSATFVVLLQQSKKARDVLGSQLPPVTDFLASFAPRSPDPDCMFRDLINELKKKGEKGEKGEKTDDPRLEEEIYSIIDETISKSKDESNSVRYLFSGRIAMLWTQVVSTTSTTNQLQQLPPLAPCIEFLHERIKPHKKLMK